MEPEEAVARCSDCPAGILTLNEGLALRFPSGEDFCLTIKRRHLGSGSRRRVPTDGAIATHYRSSLRGRR
jgi:hypothetical protein